MNPKNFLQSTLFKGFIIGLGCLVILILIFNMGVFVGTERANFAFKWADEYHRNFGGPQGGIFGDFIGSERGYANANGSYGQIIKIANNVITVKDNDGDNSEKTILAGDKTTIIFQRKDIKISDLKVGDNIIVIGEPDSNGQIQAELIRVMPAKQIPLPPILPPADSNPVPAS